MSDRLRIEDYMDDPERGPARRRPSLADVARQAGCSEEELAEMADVRNAADYAELLQRRRREGR